MTDGYLQVGILIDDFSSGVAPGAGRKNGESPLPGKIDEYKIYYKNTELGEWGARDLERDGRRVGAAQRE